MPHPLPGIWHTLGTFALIILLCLAKLSQLPKLLLYRKILDLGLVAKGLCCSVLQLTIKYFPLWHLKNRNYCHQQNYKDPLNPSLSI